MYEVPVSYEMRSYEMGKKIGLKRCNFCILLFIKILKINYAKILS